MQMAKKQYITVPKQRAKKVVEEEMSQWIKMYTEMESLL